MTYQKFFSVRYHRSGMILIDILIAFSLSAIFIAMLTSATMESRKIFQYSRDRNVMLDAYVNGSSTPIFEIEEARSCSADFANRNIAGSFRSLIYGNSEHIPNMLTASITPVMLPIDPLLPLTDLEVRDDIAYISADSSTASDPDILIFDIKDKSNPVVRFSINTGPGISSFVLVGNRIYAAALSTVAQIHVVRLDDLQSGFIESKFKLPLPYATATSPYATSIYYLNDKVFLGTTKWDGDEFSILDVGNPLGIAKIGGFETNTQVNDILVKGDLAYLATAGEKQLIALDVGNPSLPVEVDYFSPSGWQRQEGKVLSYFNGDLNFGRTSGGYNVTSDHEAFSWASTSLSTLDDAMSMDNPGGVYGILKDGHFIISASRFVDKELLITDHSFDPATAISFSLLVAPQSMTCDRDKIYVLSHTSPVIYEVILKPKNI